MILPSEPVTNQSTSVESQVRPDFLIIGHSKSGTTALHDMLAQHPQLFMCSPKEPNFFATDFCSIDTPGAFRQMDAVEYRGLFSTAPADALCGESSASNIFSQDAPSRIAQWNPSAKIIAILREPVDFLHSYHLQLLKNPVSDGETVKNFGKALMLEAQRKKGFAVPRGQCVPQLLFYGERIRYRTQLERYYHYFPSNQILALIYDDFKANNAETIRRVCRFLDVSDQFEFELSDRNLGARLRSKQIQNAVHGLSHGVGMWKPIKAVAKAMLPSTMTRKAVSWGYSTLAFSPKDSVAPKLRLELMKRFKPEVEAISELLACDLVTKWGYDKV